MRTNNLDILNNANEALRVIKLLEDAGFEAWMVGGCVRDALIGREISDIDIATSAKWEESKRVFEKADLEVRESGIKHGTITVVLPKEANMRAFEVTTYRADAKTSADCRHPDSVEFVKTIEEDLARRDFTINAIAYHPLRGVLDPYEGVKDIQQRIIRAVGDPQKRFKEDALRILRACRFSSQLGFSIDSQTFRAMLTGKSKLMYISAERISQEIEKFLLGDFVRDALLNTVDILAPVMPELIAMKDCPQVTKYHVYDVLEHTAVALASAKKSRLVRWAALCHDMGKPACAFFDEEGVEHFYGHAKVSAQIANAMLDRFKISNALKSQILSLVYAHSDEIATTTRSVRRALAKLNGDIELFKALLDLNRADILAHAPEYHAEIEHVDSLERVLEEVLNDEAAFSLRDLAISGEDVMAAGVPQGPEVGEVLSRALEAVIDEKVLNEKAVLIEYIESKLHV